jgi:hypothetical protein
MDRGRLLALAEAAGYMERDEQPLPFEPEFCLVHGKVTDAHTPAESAADERTGDG